VCQLRAAGKKSRFCLNKGMPKEGIKDSCGFAMANSGLCDGQKELANLQNPAYAYMLTVAHVQALFLKDLCEGCPLLVGTTREAALQAWLTAHA
jgi:hypothetical protein